MPRPVRLTAEEFHAIVQAFEQVGRKNTLAVSKITGKNRRLLEMLWDEGRPELGMPPISKMVKFAQTYEEPNSSQSAPVVSQLLPNNPPAGGPAQAVVPNPETPSPTSSIPTYNIPPGLTPKQSAVRRIEEDAILSMVNNLTGASVILSSLTKLIHEQVGLVKDIPDHTERRAMMKELGALMVQVGKVTSVLTDGIPRVMAAARLNTGQAGAITEVRHTGAVDVNDPNAADERRRKFDHMMSIHARAAAFVPGSYKGEEAGIIDAEVSVADPSVVGGSKPTSLVSLREGASVADAARSSYMEAEQRLRRALAERGMPSTQIDRMVDKAKARAEQLARDVSDVVDEILAQPPGEAN